jgi:hypothetical protein
MGPIPTIHYSSHTIPYHQEVVELGRKLDGEKRKLDGADKVLPPKITF